jgi:hypothetical protein
MRSPTLPSRTPWHTWVRRTRSCSPAALWISRTVPPLGPTFYAFTSAEVLQRTLRQGAAGGGGDGARRLPDSSLCALAISFYSGADTRAEARELTAQPGKRVLSKARSSDAWKSPDPHGRDRHAR